MPDRRTTRLAILLAPILAACAVGESAPPPLTIEPVAPAVDTIPAVAEPAPAAEPEPSHQERWNAPFAVRSSGRPAPRTIRDVVVLEAPAAAPATPPAAATTTPTSTPTAEPAPTTKPAPAAAAPAAPARSTPAARRPEAAVRTHRVEWAETWYGIARRYSVSPSALAAANPAVNPEKLRAGEVLSIPRADATVARSESAARSHRVGPGDTLWGIARRYGVSLDRLRAANKMESDRVRLGQTLTIPAPDPVR